MTVAKLDQTLVMTTFCPPGERMVKLVDTAIPGFIVEIYPSGTKTYALRYKNKFKKQKQHKLGYASDITCDQARKLAQKAKARVVMGEDPAEERAVTRTIPTIAELAERYLDYARTYKRSHDIDERYLRIHVLPKFGKRHLTELGQVEILEWLDAKVRVEGYAQATVNRWQVILGHMYRMAKKWGLPGSDRNPLEGVPQKACNNEVERFLTVEETQRLQDAVEASPNTQLKYIVALLLLTGCRKRELLDAKWDEFHLDRQTWRIPMQRAKTQKTRHVPLSDAAMQVLAQVPRFEGCPYVIPNPATMEPYHSVFHAWDKARKAAGLPDVRMHDLRHSAASNLVNSGQSLYVVGSILGHAQAKTTARYAHLANETLLAAANAAAGHMGTDWARKTG